MREPDMTANTLDEEAIFKVACRISATDVRGEYLQQVCGDDQTLLARVETLLSMYFQEPSFLETSGANCTASMDVSSAPVRVGSQIGPYRIREHLAEGGMGIVYVAEQTEPIRRKVALKIIKPGMATRDVVTRFEAERHTLAMMEHPNIASVFDGGATENGQPFFVMELVRGLPLTEYCDEHQLGTAERLRLFAKVCRAVQHAHQKGVIHRDLKPSNVLVAEIDDEAVPKVIDFGIAKAVSQKLTEQTVYTQFSQMLGTPLYMSPEQAGLGVIDIDTRSDVYALGVLLYELLTGRTPFDAESLKRSGIDELRRMIREQEPAKPSAQVNTLSAVELSTIAQRRRSDPRKLSGSLKGELDWIVMRPLEKDRNRRYESASALAADIERYLNNEPIAAGPPSVSYRLRKFAQRTRGRLIAGSLVAVVLLASLIVALGTKLQRDRARHQLTDDVQQLLAVARAAIASDDLIAAEQRAAELQGRLANVSDSPPQLTSSVGQLITEIEQRGEQERRFQRFEQLARDAIDDMPHGQGDDGEIWALQALELYGVLGNDQWLERLQDSYLSLQQQDAVRQRAYEILLVVADAGVRWPDSTTVETVQESFRYLQAAAAFHEPTRAFYWVRSECHKYLKHDEQVQQDLSLFQQTAATTAFDYFLPGHSAGWRGELQEAIRSYKAALRLQPNHFNSLVYLAMRLNTAGRTAEAAEVYRGCLVLRPNDLATLKNRADILRSQGEYEEALELVDRAIALKSSSAANWGIRSSVHLAMGEPEKALADLDEALRLAERDESVEDMANVYDHRAEVFHSIGKIDKAMEDLDAAVALAPQTPQKDSAEVFANVFRNRAMLRSETDQHEQALADIDETLRIYVAHESEVGAKTIALAHTTKARSFLCTGRNEEAVAECDMALKLASASDRDPVFEIRCIRASALKDLGKFRDAVSEFSTAIELDPQADNRLWPWAHNSLSWLLATCPDSSLRDAPRAVQLGRKAVALAPDNNDYWNTLGVAEYRNGEWASAVTSLTKSLALAGSGKASGEFFLAMAHWQLDKHEEARRWYEEATATMKQEDEHDEDLTRFCAEATETLEIEARH